MAFPALSRPCQFYSQCKMFYTISENYRIARLATLKNGEVSSLEKKKTCFLQIKASLQEFILSNTFLDKYALQNEFHFLAKFTDNVKNTRSTNIACLPKLHLISRSDTDLTEEQIWTDFSELNGVNALLHMHYMILGFIPR